MLKQRAGSSAKAPTYKLKVTRFCEGTVFEWIEFHKAIAELWRQNSIIEVPDKIASITSILRGDLLTGFEEQMQELTTLTKADGETEVLEATDQMITESLNAVAQIIFPFRALETQKQWMRRRMHKPKELSIRKTVAAVGRLKAVLIPPPHFLDFSCFSLNGISVFFPLGRASRFWPTFEGRLHPGFLR